MACGIYKITNLINNKCYIGQSINIEKRWTNEKCSAFNPKDESYNTALSRAFRKYGINNFSFSIIEECSREELNEKEKKYIEYYDSHYNGYNSTDGGEGNLNCFVKINNDDLKIIFDLLMNTTIPQKDIAQRFNVGQDVISTINTGKSRYQEGYDYPLRKNKKEYYCCDCGIKISNKAIRCEKCEKIRQRKVEWPAREELKNLIREKSFVEIGRKYNVSDNTIRKWCESYNLPFRKKDIKTYSNEEWFLI